jgi:hypothetical protein
VSANRSGVYESDVARWAGSRLSELIQDSYQRSVEQRSFNTRNAKAADVAALGVFLARPDMVRPHVNLVV